MTVEALTNWKDPAWIIAGKIHYFDWAILTIAIYICLPEGIRKWLKLEACQSCFRHQWVDNHAIVNHSSPGMARQLMALPFEEFQERILKDRALSWNRRKTRYQILEGYISSIFVCKKGIIEGYIALLVWGLTGPSLITCLRSLSWPVCFLSAWKDPNGVNGVNAWLDGVIPHHTTSP